MVLASIHYKYSPDIRIKVFRSFPRRLEVKGLGPACGWHTFPTPRASSVSAPRTCTPASLENTRTHRFRRMTHTHTHTHTHTGSKWWHRTCTPTSLRQRERESSLLSTSMSESTLSSRWFGGPASHHGLSGLSHPERAHSRPLETHKVLNLRTTDSQKCEAVPRRPRIQGS